MATPPRATEQESVFGVMQALSLGAILIFSALLIYLPLHAVNVGDGPLATTISNLLPVKEMTWLPMALWGAEVAIYGIIGWMIARNVPGTLVAVVLGLVARLVICVLIGLLLSTPEGKALGDVLANLHGKVWAYRVLAIVAAWATLQWPFHVLLASGFGTAERPAAAAASAAPAKAPAKAAPKAGSGSGFAFSTTKSSASRAVPSTAFPTRNTARMDEARPVHTLTPPADFVMPKPLESLYGAVELPAKVILESVPEAEPFLTPDVPVRVRLALIAPQLMRGTVWVTWGQIFSDNAKAGRTPDDEIVDRWIRIRPKYYVSQVPRDLFTAQRTPPPWMRLSEVPQENQFSLEV
jgi:hypothetical protein